MSASASPASAVASPPRRRYARWRPSAALAAMVLGFILMQVVVLAVQLATTRDDHRLHGGTALALVLGDAALIAVVIAFARRGADRLTPATFGLRRTAFGPALGWMVAIYFGVIALEALWALAVHALGFDGVTREHRGAPGAPAPATAIAIFFAIAVVAPIAEELSFRGYLFPALTRWRGPWLAAVITGLVFGAAHFLVYPPAFLPALAFFGFGSCLLFWFTGSLLPSICLHSINNAIATAVLLGWGWQVPVAILAAPAVALLLLAPFTRERAPQST